MHLRVLHRTTFSYAGKAHDSFNETRLRPIDDDTQRCQDFKLRLTPGALTRGYDDFYGNTVHYFEIIESHAKLVIEAVSTVETTPLALRPPIPRVPVADLERSA
jgi:transglutaminase-like putative cysteine protease